jgi:hypothetical protein
MFELLAVAFMGLDPIGNISLVLQVVILFLLILGLPFFRGSTSPKNMMLHGYSTITALVLHMILIFAVMVPSFLDGFAELSGLSVLASLTLWSHVILGTAAEILGIAIVAVWFSKPLSNMACGKMKRWMMPLFVIWIISIINGIIIHVFGLL